MVCISPSSAAVWREHCAQLDEALLWLKPLPVPPLTLSVLSSTVSQSHDAAVKLCSTYSYVLLISADRSCAERFKGTVRYGNPLNRWVIPWKLFLPWMIKRKWCQQQGFCHCSLLNHVFFCLAGQSATSVMRSGATFRLLRSIRLLQSLDSTLQCMMQCRVVYRSVFTGIKALLLK